MRKSRYDGADLRRMRREHGVGRPPRIVSVNVPPGLGFNNGDIFTVDTHRSDGTLPDHMYRAVVGQSASDMPEKWS